MKSVEKKANKIWPHWSQWYVAFGRCARADMTIISESLTPVKRAEHPPKGVFVSRTACCALITTEYVLVIDIWSIRAHHQRGMFAAAGHKKIAMASPLTPAGNTRSKTEASMPLVVLPENTTSV
jgi:hypothetical protein